MTYIEAIDIIKTKLESITEIAEVYAYPIGEQTRLTKYPAIIFFPNNFDNAFSDTGSNEKVFNFKVYIVVNGNGTTIQNMFTSSLPKAVDAVVAKIDADWNFGTSNGYRVWAKIQNGSWTLSQQEKSLEATAELNLSIKFSNNL